jgi:hypothetical protein
MAKSAFALVLAVVALAASPAAGSSTRAPTQLWYKLSVAYHGDLHEQTTWSGGPTGRSSGYWPIEQRRDQEVDWIAHSKRSVLVRLQPGGAWAVLDGTLLGHIQHVVEKEDTTFEYFWPSSTNPQGLRRVCHLKIERPLEAGRDKRDFEAPNLIIDVGYGARWFPSPVELHQYTHVGALRHTTDERPSCDSDHRYVNPPDGVEAYRSPLPLSPSFNADLHAQLRRSPPHFSQRGPDRFGEREIVLTSGHRFVAAPRRESTGLVYPAEKTFTANGSESIGVILELCPGRGTRRC